MCSTPDKKPALTHHSPKNNYNIKFLNISCTICMGDFADGDRLMTSKCKHSFHEECLKKWIEKKINMQGEKIHQSQEAYTYDILL